MFRFILTDVFFRCVLRDRTEPDYVLSVDTGRHHVQLGRRIDGAEQLLVQLVGAFQAEAHQTELNGNMSCDAFQRFNHSETALTVYLHIVANLETLIVANALFESLGQHNVMANVVLQSGNAVVAQHKPANQEQTHLYRKYCACCAECAHLPQLQRPKATTQRYAPVAIINGRIRIAVFQIQRVHLRKYDADRMPVKCAILQNSS